MKHLRLAGGRRASPVRSSSAIPCAHPRFLHQFLRMVPQAHTCARGAPGACKTRSIARRACSRGERCVNSARGWRALVTLYFKPGLSSANCLATDMTSTSWCMQHANRRGVGGAAEARDAQQRACACVRQAAQTLPSACTLDVALQPCFSTQQWLINICPTCPSTLTILPRIHPSSSEAAHTAPPSSWDTTSPTFVITKAGKHSRL